MKSRITTLKCLVAASLLAGPLSQAGPPVYPPATRANGTNYYDRILDFGTTSVTETNIGGAKVLIFNSLGSGGSLSTNDVGGLMVSNNAARVVPLENRTNTWNLAAFIQGASSQAWNYVSSAFASSSNLWNSIASTVGSRSNTWDTVTTKLDIVSTNSLANTGNVAVAISAQADSFTMLVSNLFLNSSIVTNGRTTITYFNGALVVSNAGTFTGAMRFQNVLRVDGSILASNNNGTAGLAWNPSSVLGGAGDGELSINNDGQLEQHTQLLVSGPGNVSASIIATGENSAASVIFKAAGAGGWMWKNTATNDAVPNAAVLRTSAGTISWTTTSDGRHVLGTNGVNVAGTPSGNAEMTVWGGISASEPIAGPANLLTNFPASVFTNGTGGVFTNLGTLAQNGTMTFNSYLVSSNFVLTGSATLSSLGGASNTLHVLNNVSAIDITNQFATTSAGAAGIFGGVGGVRYFHCTNNTGNVVLDTGTFSARFIQSDTNSITLAAPFSVAVRCITTGLAARFQIIGGNSWPNLTVRNNATVGSLIIANGPTQTTFSVTNSVGVYGSNTGKVTVANGIVTITFPMTNQLPTIAQVLVAGYDANGQVVSNLAKVWLTDNALGPNVSLRSDGGVLFYNEHGVWDSFTLDTNALAVAIKSQIVTNSVSGGQSTSSTGSVTKANGIATITFPKTVICVTNSVVRQADGSGYVTNYFAGLTSVYSASLMLTSTADWIATYQPPVSNRVIFRVWSEGGFAFINGNNVLGVASACGQANGE